MEELIKWLDANKISFKVIDCEVIEIEGFGKMFMADLSAVQSIFRGTKENLVFNLMENPDILKEEGINYVAFPFGRNWYYYDLREEFRFNILKHIGKRKPCVADVPFVNLGVHTPYELLNGSGDLSLWVKKAKLMGHTAIGICDRNTMAATLNLQKECAKEGIKHVFGYSFELEHNGEKVEMKIYCQTQKGLRNLLRIQKTIMVDSTSNTITLPDLLKYAEGNVLVLNTLSASWMSRNRKVLPLLEEHFGHLYYQVDLSEFKAERIDVKYLDALQLFFGIFYKNKTATSTISPVLICDNYYLDKDDARNKIILNKIASGAAHEQSEEQYFKDTDEHYADFVRIFSEESWDVKALFKEMCAHTVEIAEGATAGFELGKMYMPEYIMLEEEKRKYESRRKMFRSLLEEGLMAKIPLCDHDVYRKRLQEEVYIIESTNNVDYFLIQWDMVSEARRRGIVSGIGRGSAGGSLVSFLLGITSIDPVKYELLFSRFLVPERCGLEWVDEITVIGEHITVPKGNDIVRVSIDENVQVFFRDAEFRILRSGKEITVYADELKPGDELLFDNRDLLWTLKEILG
ncbi:PHP domain-containing protein [Dysgonomonas sp. 520]|uniref:PHP domain-containing protein n=1 Tax=Dysgonomonas sp. 520 TaxID=2302931 RepID=UPI0013D43925|nr:PHP domain-containing protein [Dysgonomonas sp. 520]NDW10997.1 PHP domain-containing protein [Dysgonomonas sp. 520]